jgi:hypothetical protein
MLFFIVRAAPLALVSAVLVAACGGDSSPTPPTTDLKVDGTYATNVAVAQSTCPSLTVQGNPTTVTHTTGASTLTLTHAGNSYSGTVQRNGAFSTTPKALTAGAETHTLTIAGTFSRTAINATVTAVVQRSGSADCQYTVTWIGPKQGEPNVIPGSG